MSIITPKPSRLSDNAAKSRDVLGFNKWSQASPVLGITMFILGLFVIPWEVLFRRDFGQRWFTLRNYFAGYIILFLFYMLDSIKKLFQSNKFYAFFSHYFTSSIPPKQYTYIDLIKDNGIVIAWTIYAYLGLYHLFKIWWHDRTNTARHSYDDGTSTLEDFGYLIMVLLNLVAIPFLWLCRLLLPSSAKKNIKTPSLIKDCAVFTKTVIEPVIILDLGFVFNGTASLWLFISSAAVAIYSRWRESEKRNKDLDYRDNIIESERIMNPPKVGLFHKLKTEPTPRVGQSHTIIPASPRGASQVVAVYPDLAVIIDELHHHKSARTKAVKPVSKP